MASAVGLEALESRTLMAGVLRVLALGDSITSGSTDRQTDLPGNTTAPRYEVAQTAGGYRRYLKYMLAEAGQQIDFVGNVSRTVAPDAANAYDPLFNISGVNRIAASDLRTDPESAAFPGYTIVNDNTPGTNQIAGPLTTAALATKPDVVLLHAGTNDISATSNVAKQVSDFEQLLGQIFSEAPNVKVIVAPLIPKQGLAQVGEFNRGIHHVARKFAAAGRDVVWAAKMATALQQDASGAPDFRVDQVHPNLQGYYKMARVFADAMLATPESRVAPRSFTFDDAASYRDNFYSGYVMALQHSPADGGILRFEDRSLQSYRYGTLMLDPGDVSAKTQTDSTVTADFRTGVGNATLGIYLRSGANDTGGYLGRVVIDSSGKLDLLGIYKNANAATPAVLPGEAARGATNSLNPGEWFTMRFSAINTPDGKGVTLTLAVYPRGVTTGTPIAVATWTDRKSPILGAGQSGLRFGSGPPRGTIDVDNLSFAAPISAQASKRTPQSLSFTPIVQPSSDERTSASTLVDLAAQRGNAM